MNARINSTNPGKVLIIDDSATARFAIRKVLEKVGFTVLELPSAIGATSLAKRENVRAAVIDLSMPGLSGDNLIGLMRAHPGLESLVLVVVSARSEADLDDVQVRCGADEAVSKDNIHDRLVPTLARLLCGASAARLEG